MTSRPPSTAATPTQGARHGETLRAIGPAALLLAVPLAVDRGAQLPFFTVKWLLVATLVPAGLALAALAGPLRWPAARWWAIWLTVLALATALGVAPAMSVFGAAQRNVGLVGAVLTAGAFVLGASTGGSPTALRWTARAAMISGGLVGVGAVLDRLGVDLFGQGDLDGLTRARSTWGSATFAAGFLVLVGPLAAAHVRSADRRWRAVGVAATALAVIGLVLTGTRGAWLGAAVAAVIVAWPDRHRLRGASGRAVIIGAAVALAVLAVAAVAAPALGRSTATGRLDLWRVSVDAAVDRPLLGAGPDTQRIVLPAAIDDAFERDHGSEELHDRAHDVVLDTLLTTGVVGLVALGALLLAVGRLLLAAARTGVIGRAIAAGTAGYLVHLLTAFSEASLDPLVWLLAGTGAAVATAARAPAPPPAAAASDRVGRLLVAGALAVATVAGVMWAGSELWVDHQLRDALDARAAGLGLDGLTILGDASGRAPGRFDVLQARGRLAEELRAGGIDVDLDAALDDVDDALAVARRDPDLLVDRASLLAAAGRTDDARAAYETVLAGPYPSSSRVWLGLGVVAAAEGDDAEAIRSWTRATELAPNDVRPVYDLGLLHERAKRTAKARAAYARALEIDPDYEPARAALARLDAAEDAADG